VDKRAIAWARAIAKTEAYAVSCRQRTKVEMLFAYLKRILGLDRLRLRGPSGAKDEFLLAATAQNLGNWRSSSLSRSRFSSREAARPSFSSLIDAAHLYRARPKTAFFNTIFVDRTFVSALPIGSIRTGAAGQSRKSRSRFYENYEHKD
jgi:Transposase DDE domain